MIAFISMRISANIMTSILGGGGGGVCKNVGAYTQ